jgi:DNA polymerase-3 subunit epsilon
MMRQIVLDTETTGIGPELGHRVIEIGCVELIDRKLTGNHFHVYLNPQRAVDAGAFRVHGISNEFLEDKPIFNEVIKSFLQFIDDSELIIHNAPFDVGFLNTELKNANWPKLLEDHCRVLDTLVLAKKKHPGQRNSLDALCKRYDVDNSNRDLHGALLDAEILAFVYLAMTGGQTNLFPEVSHHSQETKSSTAENAIALHSTSPVLLASLEETYHHNEFIQFLIKKSGKDHWTD